MTRPLVLTAVGLLYAAGAVWVVRGQAESYRRALAERRGAGPVATAGPVVSAPVPTPASPRPVRATPPEDAPRPAAEVAHVETPAPAPRGEEAAVRPPPLIVAGVESLPPDQEARLGRLLHELILTNHPADDDSPFARKALDAARPLLDLRDRKEVDVSLTVLDSDEVNAFSHLGGYLYVTRGLFNLAATDEEYRFVLGHELAHVDRRHGQALVAAATRAGEVDRVGTLQALYHQAAAGYTEAQENEADDWVIERMLRLDHTKRECLMFPRKLVGLSEEKGFRNGRKAPKSDLGAPVQDVGNHFRSQPAAWSRLARLEGRFRPGAAPATPTAAGSGR